MIALRHNHPLLLLLAVLPLIMTILLVLPSSHSKIHSHPIKFLTVTPKILQIIPSLAIKSFISIQPFVPPQMLQMLPAATPQLKNPLVYQQAKASNLVRCFHHPLLKLHRIYMNQTVPFVGSHIEGDLISCSPNNNCCHSYHVRCITTWLLKPNDECPMCRSDYLDRVKNNKNSKERGL